MKSQHLFFFIGILSLSASAADNKTALKVDIPKGYYEIERAEGDLNKDNSPDLAITISECNPENDGCKNFSEDHPPKTELRVYLSTGDKHALQLFATAKKAVCFQCGGMKGEPFLGTPVIANNVLQLFFSGGAREMWTDVYKWRLNSEKIMTLIGFTYNLVDSTSDEKDLYPEEIGQAVNQDINYASGKAILGVVQKNSKIKKIQCKLKSDFKLPKFEDFDFSESLKNNGTQHCDLRKSS